MRSFRFAQTSHNGDELITVYTATDVPADLNRLPNSATNGSESFGGTYVTTVDITNINNLYIHTQGTIPPNPFRPNYLPKYVTKIQAAKSSLLPDPSTHKFPHPNTYWIPPLIHRATIIQRYEVLEDSNIVIPTK